MISWFRSIGFAISSSHQFGETPYNPWGTTLAKHMLFDKIRDKLGLSACRFLAVSAAPISQETLDFFSSLNLEIHDVLGQSEGTAPLCFNTDTNQEWKMYTSGRVMKGVQVKTDPNTNEVLFKGRIVMMGYMKQPVETAATIDDDGWLHTGDMACMDAEGRIRIKCRRDNMMIIAGINIYPQEIENALRNDPRVQDVLAYAAQEDDAHPHIAIRIVCDHMTSDEVLKLCRACLPAYEQPTEIHIVQALQRNASGKLIRPKGGTKHE